MERVEKMFVLECPMRMMADRWRRSVAYKRFVESQAVPHDKLHDSDAHPKMRR